MGVAESRGYDTLQQAYGSLQKLQRAPAKRSPTLLLRLDMDPSLQAWVEPRSTSPLFILQSSFAQLAPCMVSQPNAVIMRPSTSLHTSSGTPTLRSTPATPFSSGQARGVPPPPPSVLAAARAALEMQRHMHVRCGCISSPLFTFYQQGKTAGTPKPPAQGPRGPPEQQENEKVPQPKKTDINSLEMAALAVRGQG